MFSFYGSFHFPPFPSCGFYFNRQDGRKKVPRMFRFFLKTLGAQCVWVAKSMAILWLAPHLVQTGMYSAAAEILHPLFGGSLACIPPNRTERYYY